MNVVRTSWLQRSVMQVQTENGAEVTMELTELHQLVRDHLDGYQRDEDKDTSLPQRLKEFERAFEELNNDVTPQHFGTVLIDYMNVTLTMDLKASSKDAVYAVLELIGTMAGLSAVSFKAVLDHAVICTKAKLENVRVCGVRVIGALTETWNSSKGIPEEYLDVASQALVPRFTDKARSVREAAIEACPPFFREADDPELRQSLIWNLQHDTSVTNRVLALSCLPMTAQTIDTVLSRLGDESSKIRVAAVKKLEDYQDWSSEERAILAQNGLSGRCAETKQATIILISQAWMRAHKYDPLELINAMDALQFDEAAGLVIESLLDVEKKPDDYLTALSPPEQEAFGQGIRDASQKALTVLELIGENSELCLEIALWAKAMTKHAFKSLASREADHLISTLVPDISVLCRVLGKLSERLQTLLGNPGNEGQAETDSDGLIFCSLQLLEIASELSESMEEGSRQVLTSVLKALLGNVVTPDELVQPCLETLLKVSRDQLTDVSEITVEVGRMAQEVEDLKVQYELRRLVIWQVCLEHADPNAIRDHMDKLEDWKRHVESIVRDDSSHELVGQASISCWGRLGLYQSVDSLTNDFIPLLLPVLRESKNSPTELSAQCLVALIDWCLLAPSVMEAHEVIAETLSRWLHDSKNTRHMCLSAELCCKLLLASDTIQYARNPNWVARLVMLFFHPPTIDDDDMDLGSPGRLPQVLSMFFHHNFKNPALLADSAAPLLELFASQRKKSKLIIKMLEFLTEAIERVSVKSQTDGSLTPKAEGDYTQEKENGHNSVSPEVSHTLNFAIHLAAFLEVSHDRVNVTNLRSLCKFLGEMDISHEHPSALQLRRTLDETSLCMEDKTARRNLAPLVEELSQVQDVEEEDGEERESDDEDENKDRRSSTKTMESVSSRRSAARSSLGAAN